MLNERLNLDDPGIPAERQFYSIGSIAEMLNQPPHFILRVARDAGVAPALLWNCVPVFDGTAVEKLVKHLTETVKDGARAAAAATNN